LPSRGRGGGCKRRKRDKPVLFGERMVKLATNAQIHPDQHAARLKPQAQEFYTKLERTSAVGTNKKKTFASRKENAVLREKGGETFRAAQEKS